MPKMVEKYLSESEIKKLLQCSRCRKVPTCPPIYMCKTGHHECATCFVKHTEGVGGVEETDGSTDTDSESGLGKHACIICKEGITKTRNLFAECLLIHLDNAKPQPRQDKSSYLHGLKTNPAVTNYTDCCYNIYNPPGQRFDDTQSFEPQSVHRYQPQYPIQQFDYSALPFVPNDPNLGYPDNSDVFYPNYDNGYYDGCHSRSELGDRRSRYNIASQGSTSSLSGESSKRPIRCPTPLCGRNIAVAALSHHFCFDHPEVPSVSVDSDVQSHLFIDPETIPFDYGRCIAMLLIPNKCETGSSFSQFNILSTSRTKNSLPLVVMASRLECSTNVNQSSIAEVDEEESQSDVLNRGDFRDPESAKSPLLIIWVAGIETSISLYTTIQVTEKQTNVRSVIYTGPVMSLRHSQNTSKIYEQGDCLVIHPGILENITGDRGGFDLHVMVH